jgi:hypothetical protein
MFAVFSSRKPRLDARPVAVGFVVERMALEQG